MNLCRRRLRVAKITPGNVFNVLKLSECMEDKILRDSCVYFLERNTRDVLDSCEKSKVTPAMVHVILVLSKLALHSEYELIKWLIDWANCKVREGDTSCENAREYLQNLLQDMNFLALTIEEFALLCKDYPAFFTSEEIARICLNIAVPGTRVMPDWYQKEMKIRKYIGQELRTVDTISWSGSYPFIFGYLFGLLSFYYFFL